MSDIMVNPQDNPSDEYRIQLNAWTTSFGTTQLTYALAERDSMRDTIQRLTDKLHAYEKQWTDMDYTIGHLRQENAQLKAELLCKETEWAKIFESLKAKLLEIQTSAEIDPNTAISYGLYPSSARPVNPKIK